MKTTETQAPEIAENFGQSAEYYHQRADIQKRVAKGLISSLQPWQHILPEGTILEVGCGTGFLTQSLIQMFPDREFLITDASKEMLDYCREQLLNSGLDLSRVRFEVLTASPDTQLEEESYAMVISNFAAQWFKDPSMTLQKLSEGIVAGGLLLSSFPGNQSFSNWYENCMKLGLPFTANELPDVEEVVIKLSMEPMQIDYYENDLYESYNSALDFFRHLKKTGSSHRLKDSRLSPKQLKLLVRHWDEEAGDQVKVKWHVVYLAAKKDR